MAFFVGTAGHDQANAQTGVLVGFTGTLAELTDAAGDLFFGHGGSDFVHAGSGDDFIDGYGGADTIYGGAGNDEIRVIGGEGEAGEIVDGGSDTDTLTLVNTQNFQSISINSIEILKFGSTFISHATFGANQVGSGLSTSLHVNYASAGSLTFNMGTATSLSLGSFTFDSNPIGITINGDNDAETITGSTKNDTINGGLGNDVLYGHDGNDIIYAGAGRDLSFGDGGSDTFIVIGSEFVAAELIQGDLGGPGQDTLRTIGDVNYSLGSIVSIERLEFGDYFFSGLASSATFNANQFSAAGVALNLAVSGLTTTQNSLVVNMGTSTNVNLSGLTFTSWTAGTDRITVNGDNDSESITGTSQNDTLNGGGGHDVLHGMGGVDVMNGGAGDDIYYYDLAGDVATEQPGGGTDMVRTLISITALGANLENVQLNGIGNFLVAGNDLRNTITGNSGMNQLRGLGENDILIGNGGADVILGGAGRDQMTGDGANIANSADVFHFDALSDMGNTAATRDVITDFVAGSDDLDFNGMDANSVAAGNQNFFWLGTGAFTGAGQLRYLQQGGNTIVQGNLDGNFATVEFEVELRGLVNLTSNDIVV